MTSSSLSELTATADERTLAVSGLACLERCLPVLVDDADALRPLWAAAAAGGGTWAERLAEVRAAIGEPGPGDASAAPVRRMLDGIPGEWASESLASWAALCAGLAVDVHRAADPLGDGGPLVDGERLRQTQTLDALARDEGGMGPRVALDLSTEGRRVLRAALSRKARAAGA
ncbi:hypothetical protein ACRAR1_10715 [Streptomyces sanyensis]|uniref:hypothetical protein n=1 Tax=Streptomyces sanyensis TaxID=568869 RepID=UPI003D787A59